MLTTVDKVLFLQNIDIFSDTTTEALAYIATIANEVTLDKSETIFRANDPSDALYLVIDGRVRLHRDEEEILVIGAKEAFGTWAIFDDEPRVATATTLEDSRLLKIDRDDFYDLLSDHVEITQSIFKTLVRRIRRIIK